MRSTGATEVMQHLMTKGYTKKRKNNEMATTWKVQVFQARHGKTGPENTFKSTKNTVTNM